MTSRFAEPFVDKLIMLEEKTGAEVKYRIMSPQRPFRPDPVNTQQITKTISEFIGLNRFTFCVGFASQSKNVGGHIELTQNGTDVFVEIGESIRDHSDMLVAALCHELCHKWLQVHGIRLPIEMENEILTDIACVFLGFGKILLNGYEIDSVRTVEDSVCKTTTQQHHKAGYLNRDQLALVYRLVCAMRKTTSFDALDGLKPEAIQALKSCDDAYCHLYSGNLHDSERVLEMAVPLDRRITNVQRALADLNKQVVYIQVSCLETISAFVKASHAKFDKIRRISTRAQSKREPDPALRFLMAVRTKCELECASESLAKIHNAADEYVELTATLCRQFKHGARKFPVPGLGSFSVVNCPCDGTKLRLPENAGDLIATCPTCGYRFAYNTTMPYLPEPMVAPSTSPPERKSWFSWLFEP